MALYHEGELAVQARAGVQIEASRIGRGISPTIPPIAQAFLRNQRMVVASSVDTQERVWTSLLTGAPGFLKTPDEETIEIDATPLPGDPLAENIQEDAAIGLLAIEFATRRRMRANGYVVDGLDHIVIHTQQVYSNCPKYIQVRSLHAKHHRSQPASVRRTKRLTEGQRQWIEQADTFFIGTYHAEGGADASHRGGLPGFVRVENTGEDMDRLVFPDYSGNRMFQTLGNLSINPHAGLLFLDFTNGNTLQLTGRARVHWDQEKVATFAGAERVVEYDIDEVIEMEGANPLLGQLVEYSPKLPR